MKPVAVIDRNTGLDGVIVDSTLHHSVVIFDVKLSDGRVVKRLFREIEAKGK